MGGQAFFPIRVEVGFGCDPMDPDPTWTDVSALVLRSRTISCSRGTGESGEVEPGRGQIVLANDTGDFTPGRTGAYGVVRNRLPVRIRRGAVTVWTGLVEKLSMGFDNGVRPIVTGTLVDRWSRLKARTLTGDRIQQVMQSLAPDNFWPLTDLPGATRAENATGSLWVLHPNPPVDWSTASNPSSGSLPAVARCQTGTLGSGLTMMWDGPGTATPGLYMAGVSWSAWVRCTGAGNWAQIMVDNLAGDGISLTAYQGYLSVDAYSLGVSSVGAPITLTSSAAWRHIALTAAVSGSTVTLDIYVDGVLAGTRSGTKAGWAPIADWLVQGNGADVGYAATWPRVLTSVEIQAIAASGLDALGQTGQTADVRASLAAALWAPTTVTTQGTFTATMSKQAIDGVSQADLLQQCATTEGGALYIGTGGWPVLQSRAYRSAGSAVTIPAAVLSADAQWELDDQAACNVATVDRMALGESVTTVTRRNDTSVATYTEISKSVQAWYDTDVQAVDRANGQSMMWADPVPRSRSFAVDLATCQATVSEATILGIDIGARIIVSGLPSQAPTQTAAGWYVDAIADEISATAWKRTFTVSPAIDFLVLDDPTFGGLDEWPLG